MDGLLSPIRCLTAKRLSAVLEMAAPKSWGTPIRRLLPGVVGTPNRQH